MKHKHAELIKAWADGAIIQFEFEVGGEWKDCPSNKPNWDETTEYRIKPSPKEVTVYYYEFDNGDTLLSLVNYEELISGGTAFAVYKKTITLTEDDKMQP